VLLQVKNGPIDFQPREPFHPLFGAMPRTQVMPELQITQEYLGFSNHFVFLASMWREFLDASCGSAVERCGRVSRVEVAGDLCRFDLHSGEILVLTDGGGSDHSRDNRRHQNSPNYFSHFGPSPPI